jgi:L-fucose isomerase-like protein
LVPRPNAFNTTRYSEKLLEAAGISVNTIDLSEIFGMAAAIEDTDSRVKQRIELIRAYADSSAAPEESLLRMAKFAVVTDEWMNDLGLQATAIQCWSSMQKNYHVNVCTIMSMMSEQMMPSACEVDIAGVISMYALQLAKWEAERAGGLEQQLWKRRGQVRLLPLRQLGEGLSA